MSCHSREGGNPGGSNLNEAQLVRVWNTNDASKVLSGEELGTFI
jgi:hypothetical protein